MKNGEERQSQVKTESEKIYEKKGKKKGKKKRRADGGGGGAELAVMVMLVEEKPPAQWLRWVVDGKGGLTV